MNDSSDNVGITLEELKSALLHLDSQRASVAGEIAVYKAKLKECLKRKEAIHGAKQVVESLVTEAEKRKKDLEDWEKESKVEVVVDTDDEEYDDDCDYEDQPHLQNGKAPNEDQ